MGRTTRPAWIRAADGNREVWPSRRYLTVVDLSPDRLAGTVDRLNRLVERVAAYDKVHTDPGLYQLELIDYYTGDSLFVWIYAPEAGGDR